MMLISSNRRIANLPLHSQISQRKCLARMSAILESRFSCSVLASRTDPRQRSSHAEAGPLCFNSKVSVRSKASRTTADFDMRRRVLAICKASSKVCGIFSVNVFMPCPVTTSSVSNNTNSIQQRAYVSRLIQWRDL